MTGGRILDFLGDSHLIAVESAIERGLFAPYECRSRRVGGATAIGLRHPKSRTQALTVFRERLTPFDPAVVPIFQLGEVDCGFVIWVRAQRHGESVRQQLDAALAAYGGFLVEVRDMGYADLIVTSAVLPTIRDGQLAGEVAHLRAEVLASQRERTDLTMEYNRRLGEQCMAAGLNFVDLTPDLIDPTTLLIDERFRHTDPEDHHLAPEVAGPVWSRRILAALARHP